VDKRADIWAFGVVLYEMLTGERLFAGETVSDVLAHVLTQQPDMERAPAKVRKLLRRCLEKDPRQRLRDIGEARFLLEEGEGEVPQAKARATWFLWPALAAMLGIVAASLAFVHFRQAPPEARVVNAMLPPPDGAEFDFGSPYALPALSPDGTRIVFGAKPKDGKTQLWLRRLISGFGATKQEVKDMKLNAQLKLWKCASCPQEFFESSVNQWNGKDWKPVSGLVLRDYLPRA
jgi:hypothetical protein